MSQKTCGQTKGMDMDTGKWNRELCKGVWSSYVLESLGAREMLCKGEKDRLDDFIRVLAPRHECAVDGEPAEVVHHLAASHLTGHFINY